MLRAKAGSASGSKIFHMTLNLLAPVEIKASMTPRFTSEKLACANLAKNAIAAMESGTRTAFEPIFVPTTNFDKGKSKTIKIKNGTL